MPTPAPGTLEYLADADPARLAIVGEQRTLSRGEWDRRASALAAGLQEEYGLAAGDRVGLAIGAPVEYLEVTFALAKLGVAPVAIETDVAARLAAVEAELLIAEDPAHDALALGDPYEALIARHLDAPRRLSGSEPAPAAVTFDADGRALVREFAPERLAAVGRALGDLLTRLGVGGADVHLLAAPPHRAAPALLAGVTLIAGGTVVALRDPTPEAIVAAIAQHQVTTAYLTIDQLAMLPVGAAATGPLRALITSGPVAAELAERLGGDRLHSLFETPATGTVALQTPADRAADPDSIGRPLAGVETRTAAGGELLVRSPLTADRYLDEATTGGGAGEGDGWWAAAP